MGGLDGPVDGGQQFAAHRVEIDRVPQPQREGRDDRVGVVAGAVEAPIDEPLHPQSKRVEERGRGERRGGDARPARRTAARRSPATTIPTNTPASSPVMIR